MMSGWKEESGQWRGGMTLSVVVHSLIIVSIKNQCTRKTDRENNYKSKSFSCSVFILNM